MKFRKKPVVIEAAKWSSHGDHPAVSHYPSAPVKNERCCQVCGVNTANHGWVETLEGGHMVCPGDWIITGVHGEHYPCKPDIFELTYEAVEP